MGEGEESGVFISFFGIMVIFWRGLECGNKGIVDYSTTGNWKKYKLLCDKPPLTGMPDFLGSLYFHNFLNILDHFCDLCRSEEKILLPYRG